VGRRIGPKKVHRYSVEFKLTAVKLSRMAGVEVQTVAEALDIHPIMLSRWRTQVRDGVLKGRATRVAGPAPPRRELRQLQVLKRTHAILQAEHELLKKAIRFSSERKRRSSGLSMPSGQASA
jgi:transposase